MKAQKEAEDLVNQFYSAIPEEGFAGTYSTFRSHARKCASLSIDEIIKALEEIKAVLDDSATSPLNDNIAYYEKVKEFIKLT